MTSPTPAPADQWRALVLAETRRCGHALLAILHCKRSHPELWEAVHAPERVEAREAAAQYERQVAERVERQ